MSTTLSPLAAAISQLEGYGASATNIPTLANNPGDLELGDIGYGTLTASGGNKITVFPTLAAGQAALEAQVSKMENGGSSVYTPSETIAQAGATYGGSSTYGQKLAQLLGVDSSASLSSLASGISGTSNTASSVVSAMAGGIGGLFTDYVVIILGLILIAAGVFAFKQTQTVIESAGKVAGKIAEVSA